MLLLGLFLQLPISQHRAPRAIFGVMLTASMLVTHPKIYASDTQMMGLTLACFCCELAWTILHWTFLETNRRPTVLEVCVSPVQHLAHGMRKAHQRSLQLLQQDNKPACKPQPIVLVHADGPGACEHAAQAGHLSPVALVLDVVMAITRLLLLCFMYDLVQYTLCAVFASQMCAGGGNLLAATGGIFSTPVATTAVAAGWLDRLCAHVVTYLQLCLFGVPAALLMGLMMEIEYACIKLILSLLALVSPAVALFTRGLPDHAFNRPWAAASLTELWGTRWHQFLRFYFEGLGFTAADKLCSLLAKVVTVPARARAAVRVAAAFVMSGLVHEYLVYAAFGRVSGCYMAFFGLHGLGVLLERCALSTFSHSWARNHRLAPSDAQQTSVKEFAAARIREASSHREERGDGARLRCSRSACLQRCWAWAVCILTLPLFFEPLRSACLYNSCAFQPFGAPLAARLMARLGLA